MAGNPADYEKLTVSKTVTYKGKKIVMTYAVAPVSGHICPKCAKLAVRQMARK